jgi:hypothetical protein
MGASNMVWRGKLAAETISIPCSNPDLKKKGAGRNREKNAPQMSPHIYLKSNQGQVTVAHAYNPSYSGSRDQEDHGSKPAWENNL